MSANFNPIMPCEENEVVQIVLTTIQEANLENDFIPIVRLDKSYEEKGFKYTDSRQEATLSPYLGERNYALETVMFDNSEEFVLRFEIKQGNSIAKDNHSLINAECCILKYIQDKKQVILNNRLMYLLMNAGKT